jgi:FtsP/CotA-like multicopper oxidase with cupredoxin domain
LKKQIILLATAALMLSPWPAVMALAKQQQNCLRPTAGSVVTDPASLRSHNGVLHVELTIHNALGPDGSQMYCYSDAAGDESPTLRVKPGDRVTIDLKNDLTVQDSTSGTHSHSPAAMQMGKSPCTSGKMSATSTNLHFHGLTIPPVCHQDDVLKTSIQPGDPPFEYKFQIPSDEPPGLYWYHPHIHGFSEAQVLGGASGALIVEGIERANPALAGLPDRVIVLRDQDLMHPNAPPAKSEPVVPSALIERDGDTANNGTGFGKPAKDLSINFIPVPYPDYPPAVIEMKPGERQLWRVLNASAITYVNLAVLFGRTPQPLGLVALDGVPLDWDGVPADAIRWETHLGIPPGSRMEFIVTGPPAGETGLLVTRTVDTGPAGENDPNRALAKIVVSPQAPEPSSRLELSPKPLPPQKKPWLGNVTPTMVRHLYFSEKLANPDDPTSAVEFYITVDGQKPAVFDPHAAMPNIVVKQGTVEDWIIENRSSELHAFHIHQLHFLLMDYLGRPVHEPFLRDTVNVPYFNGKSLAYPSVRLRMDFRDPNIVGTFVYHCHLLDHEDKGMMGTIRVEPAEPLQQESTKPADLPAKR